jgi:predicted metal-dependent hydrolase
MTAKVEVIRSTRRKRSSQAYSREDGTIVVRIPAHLTMAEQDEVVQTLVAKVTRRMQAREITDEMLLARAHVLADTYLDGVRAQEVVWSARMERRWASCSIQSRRIRVSNRLAAVPSWVLDGVLVHELAHLQQPNHSAAFHDLVARYPKHERVRGFLEGMGFALPADGTEPPQDEPLAADSRWGS